MNTKSYYIKLFRDNGFNCFPIPKYDDSYPEHKAADIRYKGARTELNQPITENENYGVIAIKNMGTCFIDLDHKENYRKFAEENIKNGYMVIETPNGWHIPIKGLSGNIQKVMLYDYTIEPHKQIIEIQGHDHYVIGVGSEIVDRKTKQKVSYKSVGSNVIWDAKGMDFHKLIDSLCKFCHVEAKKKARSTNFDMRKRFAEGKLPTRGTSNDYFFNAAIYCLSEGMTEGEAINRIKEIYDKWAVSDSFSGRPWGNIETKIADAYENAEPLKEGRPKGKGKAINRLEIAQTMINGRKIYSDIETGEVYEDKNGFLEKITKSLQKEVQTLYPILQDADYRDIIFKLKGLALPIPPTNKDIFAFKNGKVDRNTKQFVESDDIADMGFRDYNYLPKSDENQPTEFLKILFENSPEHEYPRIKAGLRGVLRSRMDSRISVIHGKSGMGKTTPLVILADALGEEYALVVEFKQFIDDRATRAKIKNKRLLVFQDMPDNFKDFSIIKSITGEKNQSIRGFQKDLEPFPNKLKIWASANYLPEIPPHEKDPMYGRRLSLIHNIRTVPYAEDDDFQERIATQESEKIISWILNLSDDECKYEDRNTVRKEWEEISSPEKAYLLNYWVISEDPVEVSVSKLVKDYQDKYQTEIPFDTMVKTLKSMGYSVRNNIISNITTKPIKKPEGGQGKL
uniref:ORF67 n=1 Tax=Nitrosopumilaceae spindle-shaped virus TaxID=3065433 RepID=A0AAT9JB40_9VIRU